MHILGPCMLGMGSANGRRRYYVTPSLTGLAAHTQNDSCTSPDFDPTFSGRDTTKLWSFPLGFFQGQLGTVSWCVFGKYLWGYIGGSRSLTLLCRACNQGCKWMHPKGNHHPQELELSRKGPSFVPVISPMTKAAPLRNHRKGQMAKQPKS